MCDFLLNWAALANRLLWGLGLFFPSALHKVSQTLDFQIYVPPPLRPLLLRKRLVTASLHVLVSELPTGPLSSALPSPCVALPRTKNSRH